MKKKTAIITGVTGQDGSYLARLLIKKGITVANLANSFSYEGTRFQGLCDAARTCLKTIKS